MGKRAKKQPGFAEKAYYTRFIEVMNSGKPWQSEWEMAAAIVNTTNSMTAKRKYKVHSEMYKFCQINNDDR